MKVECVDNVGVQITGLDICKMTSQEYSNLTEIFFEHLLVSIPNQPVDPIAFAKIAYQFGDIVNLPQCVWNSAGEEIGSVRELDPFQWHGTKESFPVQRVTGKKVNGKDSGIFGSGVLDWHSNINGVSWAPGVGLQAVAGVDGTSTSWMDTTKAYDDLSDSLKLRCETVIGHFKYSPEVWAEGLPPWLLRFMTQGGKVFLYEMPLVNLSECGRKGLYFHYLNDCSFPSDPQLFQILKEHCFQSKYIQTIKWRPGDIHLSHQIFTLHRRNQDDPAILSNRILHRLTFNFNKIYPEAKPLYISRRAELEAGANPN